MAEEKIFLNQREVDSYADALACRIINYLRLIKWGDKPVPIYGYPPFGLYVLYLLQRNLPFIRFCSDIRSAKIGVRPVLDSVYTLKTSAFYYDALITHPENGIIYIFPWDKRK